MGCPLNISPFPMKLISYIQSLLQGFFGFLYVFLVASLPYTTLNKPKKKKTTRKN
jgi:hypothetical protein